MVVSDEALRPFRSRRGRLVATVMAVVSLLVFGAIAVLLPTNAGLTTWQPVESYRAVVPKTLLNKLEEESPTKRPSTRGKKSTRRIR